MEQASTPGLRAEEWGLDPGPGGGVVGLGPRVWGRRCEAWTPGLGAEVWVLTPGLGEEVWGLDPGSGGRGVGSGGEGVRPGPRVWGQRCGP